MRFSKYNFQILFITALIFTQAGCQKSTTAPDVSGVASFTVVNAIPNANAIIPVINISQAIMWFSTAKTISYGKFSEYSPVGGNDTVYAVQRNSDTLNVGAKSGGLYYNILPLIKGGIYSLFLCGADTSSVDNLFTIDTLPYHGPSDSTLGIRFVNLSAGSGPISVNLEGSANGSAVSNLPYKSITGFTGYPAKSSVRSYQFVFRDAVTGDSLTQFKITSNAIGLYYPGSPNGNNSLIFRNITLALYGSEIPGTNTPLKVMLIANY